MAVNKTVFGTLPDGSTAYLYTLTNTKGMTVKITNYGGIVTSIQVPDKNGILGEVTLGFDSLEGYLSPGYLSSYPYFGAIMGRFAGRIANGVFSLNNQTYTLLINNGGNHLHGGGIGFDRVLWGEELPASSEASVKLTYTSKDGEEGYPGTVNIAVVYTLTEDNGLKIDYTAESDAPTPINLTNHAYFNLAGKQAKTVLDHELLIHADQYLELNPTSVPTGKILSVKESPMDFTTSHRIGERSDLVFPGENAPVKGGYDHCYVLRSAGTLHQAACVTEPQTGRVMDVWTTEPAVQLYTSNYLHVSTPGHDGTLYSYQSGLCLETQHYPDAPNHAHFPSTILTPGETLRSTTIYQFSVKK